MRLISGSLVASVLLIGASVVRADIALIPGGSSVLVPEPYYGVFNDASGVSLDSRGAMFSGNPNIQASIVEEVWREPGGTLDFLFQLTAGPRSGPISDMLMSNFGNGAPDFITRAGTTNDLVPGFATVAFGVRVIAASRSSAGTSLDFEFDPTNGGGLGSNGNSKIFFVRTNATAYDDLGVATINGFVPPSGVNPGSSTVSGLLEPTSFVPEPAGCGLIFFGVWLVSSRRHASPSTVAS